MFCSKCGSENPENVKYCNNCGELLGTAEKPQDTVGSLNKKLYSAHLINIIATVVLVLAFILICYCSENASFSNERTTNGTTTTTTVSIEATNAPFAQVSCLGGAIVAIIGFVIYSNKEVSTKKKLATIYLILSIIMAAIFAYASLLSISFTCGLGFIMLIVGILQIVAGAKFSTVLKNYE